MTKTHGVCEVDCHACSPSVLGQRCGLGDGLFRNAIHQHRAAESTAPTPVNRGVDRDPEHPRPRQLRQRYSRRESLAGLQENILSDVLRIGRVLEIAQRHLDDCLAIPLNQGEQVPAPSLLHVFTISPQGGFHHRGALLGAPPAMVRHLGNEMRGTDGYIIKQTEELVRLRPRGEVDPDLVTPPRLFAQELNQRQDRARA